MKKKWIPLPPDHAGLSPEPEQQTHERINHSLLAFSGSL